MSVDTIIVNFRTKELALDATRSVIDEPETNRVILVDNGSGDDSAEWLRAHLQSTKATVISSEKNLGFGGGNNLGAEEAEADLLFLLNSDATIQPGGLASLIEAMNPAVGVAAPAIYLPSGELQDDAFGPFPTPGRLLTGRARRTSNSEHPDWVTGCAMLVRRREFVELGGFDEDLFMYFEDVDLCRRYADRGLRTVRAPAAKVIHLGGASRASTKAQKEQFRKSMDYYLEKHGFPATSRAVVKMARTLRAKIRGH